MKEAEKETAPRQLFHSSNASNSQNCTGLKPWTWNSIQVSPVNDRNPTTWSITDISQDLH